jgi:Ca2+-binding RTX toxin-like protein
MYAGQKIALGKIAHTYSQNELACTASPRSDRRGIAGSGNAGRVRYAVLAAVLLLGLLGAPALAATWNEIEGTANADHIRGTFAPDRIQGLEGNDVVRGGAGDDRLVGGPGDDRLVGGPGHDTFLCGGGEDVVVVDFSRFAERIGDGCEALILDV